MSMVDRTVVLWSGGLDSTVLVAHLLDQGHEVVGLGIHYGQRHVKELHQASQLARYYGVPYKMLSVPGLGELLTSSLTTGTPAFAPTKVVPNRNAILVNIAVGMAVSYGFNSVAIGCNADDTRDFYDCRPQFLDSLGTLCDFSAVELLAPWWNKTKGWVAAYAVDLDVPVDMTWSCYTNGREPCGECDACRDRAKARGVGALPG